MSQPDVDTRRMGELKTNQGDIKLNREEWFKGYNFRDPFPASAVQAEDDNILKDDIGVFVQVPYYGSIVGTPVEPGYHFIFGQTGGGKTSIREAIKLHYDDSLGNNEKHQVLVVVYNSFEKVSSILASNNQSEQALFQHHIEKIIEIILFRLFEIWSDKKKSALLKNVQHKDTKKQLRWYLQKYLRLFPWQFEKLQKKVDLRSYLPLFHYLIRVLLGALKSLLPPAKPLVEELGKFSSYTIDDHSNIDNSAFNLLSELINLCAQIGFNGVYVLVDDLDNGYSESEKNLKGFKRIAPLLFDHRVYSSIDKFVLKLFIPSGMKEFFLEEIDTGRMLTIDLDWTKELIQQAYEQRLQSCRLGPSLAGICSSDLKTDIDKFMLQYGMKKKTPRALIELGFRLLDEHFAVGERSPDDLIPKDTWDRALEKVGESSFSEEVGL